MPIDVACPNLSLDRTIAVPRLLPGGVHRSARSDARGGGKGANVVRALRALGRPASLTGILAGRTGSAVAAMLADEGTALEAVRASGETRSCLTVLAEDAVTVFNESGPALDRAGWRRYRDLVEEHLRPGSVFVCSGSFPPGAPDDAAAHLAEAARAAGCSVVVDTSRTQLERVLACEPDLIKPNIHEAAAVIAGTTEERVDAGDGALERAAEMADSLRERGPRAVVVSAGAAGAALASDDGTVTRTAPEIRAVNPVGAGDCMVAAFAALLEADRALDEAGLGFAVTVGSAGCETFAAGEVDAARVDDLLRSL